MRLRGLLDRLVLLVGVLAGGVLPGFVQQYRQRIGGRLDEARQQLGEWQALADRLFGADLDALAAHHRQSSDTTFAAEAALIEQTQARVLELEQTLAALQGSLWERTAGFLTHADWMDVQATWSLFQPDFPLHPETLFFALCFGGAVWLLWLGLVRGVVHVAVGRRRERRIFAG